MTLTPEAETLQVKGERPRPLRHNHCQKGDYRVVSQDSRDSDVILQALSALFTVEGGWLTLVGWGGWGARCGGGVGDGYSLRYRLHEHGALRPEDLLTGGRHYLQDVTCTTTQPGTQTTRKPSNSYLG